MFNLIYMVAIVSSWPQNVNDVSANLLHKFHNFIVILAKISISPIIFRHFQFANQIFIFRTGTHKPK